MKRPSEGGLEAVLIKRLAHYMLELSPRHRGTGFPRSIRHSCAAGLRQHGPACSPGEKSGNFDFILGDKSHLESTDLAFSGELVIGKRKQVAATAKEGKLTSQDELTGQAVTRIAIADSKMRFTVMPLPNISPARASESRCSRNCWWSARCRRCPLCGQRRGGCWIYQPDRSHGDCI